MLNLIFFFSFFNIFLGIIIPIHAKWSKNSFSFVIFAFSVSLWIFSTFLFHLLQNPFFIKLAYALGCLVTITGLVWVHFFLRGYLSNNVKYVIIPLSSIFIYIILLTNLVIKSVTVVSRDNSILQYNADLGAAFNLFFLFFIFIISCIFYLFVYHYFFTKQDKLKKQIKIIAYGSVFFVLISVTVSFILPVFFNNFSYAFLDSISFSVLLFAVVVAILRYELFDFKIVAAELFVFSLWIILIIKMTSSGTPWDFLISGFILLVAVLIGIFLIKNVNKEIRQREEIEKLAKKLEKTNNKLRELDKMKTEFLSLATHQIRSPLTSMRGYISMIFEGDYGEVNENLKEPLRVVEKSSEGLVKIVNDFLDVSRIEQGRMKYNLEVYDFRQIVKNIIEEYRPAIEEKGLKIEFEAKEDDYSVKVDENKMEQVIGNLIDNAIKYTIDGEIKVHLFKNDSKTVQLEVSDSGVGIPPEEIKKLFTKFQRAKGAEKTNVTGTGLGIYLAKRITEDHGGTIKVESEGEGKGSVFTVTLPVV